MKKKPWGDRNIINLVFFLSQFRDDYRKLEIFIKVKVRYFLGSIYIAIIIFCLFLRNLLVFSFLQIFLAILFYFCIN